MGYLGDFTLAMTLGIVLVYILRRTGKDYALIKGLGLGAITYMLLYGIAMALNFTRINLRTPLPSLLLFISHLVFGGFSAWAVQRYDSLD